MAPAAPRPQAPTVAITGARGALGQALLRQWHRRGARLIALSSGSAPLDLRDSGGRPIQLQQVLWQVGEEQMLAPLLQEVDVLVLNHGINVHGCRSEQAVASSLEVNALSSWRLLELFAAATAEREQGGGAADRPRPEVWVNTSEAEVQPALSPLYEISKRLMGQLLSLRALELGDQLRLRRLVLGPFRSALNPIGVMAPDLVAALVLRQAELNWGLIIVTPNPLTYVTMPLSALGRWLYFRAFTRRPASP